jgi:ABC-type transport system substrate-binding protein
MRPIALGIAVGGAALLLAASGSPRATRDGGTFVVDLPATYFGPSIDASLNEQAGSQIVLEAVCSSLMNRPDAPLPDGFRAEPELASSLPKIASDGKTYTFTLRKGQRFSTGKRVTAQDVAYTVNRLLSPDLEAKDTTPFDAVVGAKAVMNGTATSASGIVARGDTVTFKLTRPVGNFAAAFTGLCMLPAGLPIDPEGVKAPVPSAAPYYISEYAPGERIVLLRNRFYGGVRQPHVSRIVVDLSVDRDTALANVTSGKADFLAPPMPAQYAGDLAKRYGVNRSQFFVKPANVIRLLVLNTSQPLLRKNVALRQAINYAVDRPALVRRARSLGVYAGTPTDQYLPPIMPGFKNARIYPLKGPDIAKARALAKGHTRSGKLVLYVSTRPGVAEQAQIVKQNLATIGLEVEIKAFTSELLFQKLATPGEPFDMGWIGWQANVPDPGTVSELFDGSAIPPAGQNFSYFDSPKYNRLLQQASRLTGEERYRAYGQLDVQLARDAAPAVAYGVDNALTFVSNRTGCVIVRPYLDLAAVCLK